MGEQERPHPLLIDRHQNGDEEEGGGVCVGGGGAIKARRLCDGFIFFCSRRRGENFYEHGVTLRSW